MLTLSIASFTMFPRVLGVFVVTGARSRSAFPSTSGSFAMLIAIRRASSFVSTFACRASASLSREYR
jgi:hypothetical protein